MLWSKTSQDQGDFGSDLFVACGGAVIDTGERASSASYDAEDPERWLLDSTLLEVRHPKIRLLAQRLTQLRRTQRQKAQSCYSFVRAMPFGCIADSTGTTARGVLDHGMGDCHTKSTLLVALLRASGIPARMRFVTLRPDFLHGIIDTHGGPIEHGMAEILIEGAWLAVDSYVVDVPLALAAKARLMHEDRRLGYGMHSAGKVSWDGAGPSLAQFSPADSQSMPLQDWGVFDDPLHFYSSVSYMRKRLGWAMRTKWLLGAVLVNHRVEALRNSLRMPAAHAA